MGGGEAKGADGVYNRIGFPSSDFCGLIMHFFQQY